MSVPPAKSRHQRFLDGKCASFSKLLLDPVPPREPIIEPWLDRGSAALVWGSTGVGKSYFAQTLALMVASGGNLPELGWSAGENRAHKVLWFDGEQGIRTAQNRSRQLVCLDAGHHAGPIDIAEDTKARLRERGFEDTLDYRSKVIAGEGYPDLGVLKDREMIERVIKEGKFDLVIFDNLMVMATVESWDDAAALGDMCSWFNLMAKRCGCAVIVMHHARKDATAYNGSARIGQDFEVIASLQPPQIRKPVALAQTGPGFTVEFNKMRDQPDNWNSEPIHMVLTRGAWCTWEPQDVGKHVYGKVVSDKDFAVHYFDEQFRTQQELADYLGISAERVRQRAVEMRYPVFRDRLKEPNGESGAVAGEVALWQAVGEPRDSTDF